MRTFIQLRDGVGFATLVTAEEEPDHSVTPDHTTAVEVTGQDNPDQFLKMKYDEKTKTWSKAPLIYYGEVDEKGRVVEIRRTYFSHETEGFPILPSDFDNSWTWVDGEWVKPYIDVEEVPAVPEIESEPEEQRIARVIAQGGIPS